MAKLKSKKIRKQQKRKQQRTFDKRIGIGLGIFAAILLICFGGYYLVQQYRIAKTDVSLEELCEGGATIYAVDGTQYTVLEIEKAAGWITTESIPDTLRGIDDLLGKSYGKLIAEQFFPEALDCEIKAKALEQNYSETELEDFFLNTVYLGDGVYGIGSGAKHFYGCEYEVFPEAYLQNFRDIIVYYLENKTLENTNVAIYEGSMIYEENGYIDGVVKETAAKLIEAGMDELVAYNQVFFGNLSIYTHMDTSVQEILDEAYADSSTFTPVERDYTYIQSGMIIMDHVGHVKAVASGNNEDKVLNRALSQNYKVGSTIKPVSTYSLGIENGHIHFSSMIENEQMIVRNARGEESLWPSNSDGQYGGEVVVTKALQESKNTVAVAIGRMVGEEVMYDFMKNTLDFDLVYFENGETDAQLSAMALGYLYKGASLAKMTSAYEIFSNQGQYNGFTMVKKVVSFNHENLVEEKMDVVQALSPETAYITNRLLYNNVNEEYGIAKAAQIEGEEVLGKTGTVGNGEGQSTSRMFIGLTSDYIAGVWIGYDDERSLSLQSYYNPDAIFSNIMSHLPHSGASFIMPEGIIEHAYCEKTGMLATEHCQHTKSGYYTQENMPAYCTVCGK